MVELPPQHLPNTEVKEGYSAGSIQQINRFPVKSMRGETLEKSWLGFNGLSGDRRFAFVQGDDKTKFPWLTGREFPDMLRYTPEFISPYNPDNSQIKIHTPEGETFDFFDPELVERMKEQMSGRFKHGTYHPVHLKRTHDNDALSLLTNRSTDKLENEVDLNANDLRISRFRMNLIIDEAFWPEEEWIGRRIKIGVEEDSPIISVTREIERCVMISRNPYNQSERDVHDKAIFKAVTQKLDNHFGVYATVIQEGSVSIGDQLYLLD